MLPCLSFCVSVTVHKPVESGEVVAVCTGMHGTGYRPRV